ncbi:PDDEXK nuclease domain-containing protein [Dyadobacter chenhuakuii]|uniref:PDDEXK nuclease domain-containing protein n=1 Tax=Dyadobacter chenhuakuii TaxID=2909339 RepID=A0A9X1TTB2_9BACT|nr:PDDEXK nuclease domain-containing protein [Dyadobacter chenhuakuii]MCF2498173.1 PDDEXK nuclease domain-containing protein [Dyadobacter chenhuakuii]
MQLFSNQYPQILAELKSTIRQSRLKASLSVNAEMLMLYWQIGKTIIEQQQAASWGAKIIDQLASDLRNEFPDMQGLSPRNLKYMRQFATAYPDPTFVQAALAQITWYHHITLLTKVKEPEERHFYIQETATQGWSRDVMVAQIETGYFRRKGHALTNFNKTLPGAMSDLAKYITKDPYVFDFLSLADEHNEKDLEDALTDHITKFLLELGAGFAYVGRQYLLEVGEQDFFIDLLFYHVKLHAFVVIELKRGKFMPEYAGKLNFYLSVIDDKLKSELDQPSIGILICQSKDQVVAEYALKDITKPIGISSYKLTDSIPENLKGKLPTIEEIEKELGVLKHQDVANDS